MRIYTKKLTLLLLNILVYTDIQEAQKVSLNQEGSLRRLGSLCVLANYINDI